MTRSLSIAALLFFATVVFPQQPVAPPTPPKAPTVEDVQKADADAEAAIKKANATRLAFDKEIAKLKLPSIGGFAAGLGKPGKDGLSAYEVAKKNGFAGTEAEWLASLRGPPGPVGPPGPPAPGPTPIPVPPPADAPIKADGFHVLVLFQDKDAAKLPKGQFAAIYGTDVRTYLNAKCPKDQPSGLAGWRFFDVDQDLTGAPKHFLDASNRPRPASSLPWLIVSDGKKGWEGPLPATVPEIMAKLKEFGGE